VAFGFEAAGSVEEGFNHLGQGVRVVEALGREVAALHPEKLGVGLTKLTGDQAAYIQFRILCKRTLWSIEILIMEVFIMHNDCLGVCFGGS
jgi:hypothetical protein